MSKNKKIKTGYLRKRYRKNPNIVSRKIADETVLVPIMQKRENIQSIFTLNEVGSFIWELINNQRQVSQIRDLVTKEFDVTSQEAEEDLIGLLKQLEKVEAIKENS